MQIFNLSKKLFISVELFEHGEVSSVQEKGKFTLLILWNVVVDFFFYLLSNALWITEYFRLEYAITMYFNLNIIIQNIYFKLST